MAASPSPTRSDDKLAQVWTVLHRGKANARTLKRAQALLVICGLWAMGTATGTAWAAPTGGRLSCGAPGIQPSLGRTLNAGGAHITLNSSQGTGGTKLLVLGTGWPAQAQITVTEESNGQGILGNLGVKAVAAADGTFAAPAFGAAIATCGFDPSPGLVVQIVARTADQQVSAVAPFTYVTSPPTLARLREDSVLANTPFVPIEGANWDAGVAVTLWTSPQLAALNTQDPWLPPPGARTTLAQADLHGDITADVPLPTGLRPGTWIVVGASATSARYGALTTTLSPFMVRPPLAPALRLDRTQGSAGARFTVSGAQYWPNDTVTIAYCRGAPASSSQPSVPCNQYLSQALGQTTVDRAGRFTVRVMLPSNARIGPITIEAYATTPVAAMSDPYTVTAPFHIVAPASAQTGWQTFAKVHPRLARALTALALGTPVVLGLLGLAGAVWLLSTRRRRGLGPR